MRAALACVAAVAVAGPAPAGAATETTDPTGRGLQVLTGREAILLDQARRSDEAARARGLALYRLFRRSPGSPGGVADVDRTQGDRAAQAATTPAHLTSADAWRLAAVLERDLREARLVRDELQRVRAERARLEKLTALAAVDEARAPLAKLTAGALGRPVAGRVVTPFGVGKDVATGAWLFRPAVALAARPREAIVAPVAGRVVRVAGSVTGAPAVVIAAARGLTVIVDGFGSVAVGPGEDVMRGQVLGRAGGAFDDGAGAPGGAGPAEPRAGARARGGDTGSSQVRVVRFEVWRARQPVDPMALVGPSPKATASGAVAAR